MNITLRTRSTFLTTIIITISIQLVFGQTIINKPVVIKYLGTAPYFLYYTDNFLEDHDIVFVKDRKNNNFNDIKLLITQPTMVRFTGDNDQFPVLLYPSDTLEIDSKNMKINSKRPYEMNFYAFLEKQKIGMGYPDFFDLTWTPKSDFRAIVDEFRTLRDKRIKLLDSLKNTNNISEHFYKKTANELNSAYIWTLLLPFRKSQTQIFNVNMLPAWYTDTLSRYKSFFNDPELLGASSLYYRHCLISYSVFLAHTDNNNNNRNDVYVTAKGSFQGIIRDYVLFSLVKNQLESSDLEIGSSMANYNKDISDRKYVNNLDSTIRTKQQKKSIIINDAILKATFLEKKDGSKIVWNDILIKNKNNVIYADLWASWCGPCRKEMPNSINLAKQLHNSNIQFIYISIDDNRSKWLNALSTLFLVNDNAQHYRLDPQTLLAKSLTNGAVPKYIIIDKQGQVQSLDGTRPGDKKTEDLLIRLAK